MKTKSPNFYLTTKEQERNLFLSFSLEIMNLKWKKWKIKIQKKSKIWNTRFSFSLSLKISRKLNTAPWYAFDLIFLQLYSEKSVYEFGNVFNVPMLMHAVFADTITWVFFNYIFAILFFWWKLNNLIRHLIVTFTFIWYRSFVFVYDF